MPSAVRCIDGILKETVGVRRARGLFAALDGR